MSHGHAETGEHTPHVLPIKVYLAVWAALLVLTVVTVWVSYFDFGNFNLIVAMGVATFKATLVALYFMHLKYDEKFNSIVFVSSLVFLGIFFVLTLADTMERGNVDAIESREIELVPARPELLELKNQTGDGHGGAHGDDAHGGGHGDDAHGETAVPHGESDPAAAGHGDDHGAAPDTGGGGH